MRGRKSCSGGAVAKSAIAEGLMGRKSGGAVAKTEIADSLMKGAKSKFRLDKPGRKRGGRVGSDGGPLTSAGRGDHPHTASDHTGGVKGGEPGYRGGKISK